MKALIEFLVWFITANPLIEGSVIYNAAWLKFVRRDVVWSTEQFDCRFTNALEMAHSQIIRPRARRNYGIN